MVLDKLKNSASPLLRKLANIKHFWLIVLMIVVFSLIILMTKEDFSNNDKTSTNSTGLCTESELRLQYVLESIDGIDKASVFINENESRVNSVIIVLNGEVGIATRINALSAVQTALNITSDKIKLICPNN